jgi:hypothetical protein
LSGDYAGPEITREVFQGRIGFVDTLSDAANGDTRVWAEVKNPDNILRPGFKATMIIYSRSSNPKSSLDRPRKRSQLARAAPNDRRMSANLQSGDLLRYEKSSVRPPRGREIGPPAD